MECGLRRNVCFFYYFCPFGDRSGGKEWFCSFRERQIKSKRHEAEVVAAQQVVDSKFWTVVPGFITFRNVFLLNFLPSSLAKIFPAGMFITLTSKIA